MMRRALPLILLTGIATLPAAKAATGPASPSPEQADLQAAQASELAIAAQAQAGGDTQKPIAHLELVFTGLEAKYPQSAAIRDEHANFLWMAQRNQDAFVKWQEAEKLDVNNADVCEHLGACWMNLGDSPRAASYFERAVALAPQDAALHFALGNNLYLFRHALTTPQVPETAVVDHALAELRKAADLQPLDAEYAVGYAETFYSIPVSKWPDAIKAWQHYYDISSNKDLAAINLARVSLQMKDKPAARAYLAKVNGAVFQTLKRKLLAQAGAE